MSFNYNKKTAGLPISASGKYFGRIPCDLLALKGRSSAKVLYAALSSRANYNDLGQGIFPSLETLVTDTGLTRRTILDARDILVKEGFITYESGGGRRSNTYFLTTEHSRLSGSGNNGSTYASHTEETLGLVQELEGSSSETAPLQRKNRHGNETHGLDTWNETHKTHSRFTADFASSSDSPSFASKASSVVLASDGSAPNAIEQEPPRREGICKKSTFITRKAYIILENHLELTQRTDGFDRHSLVRGIQFGLNDGVPPSAIVQALNSGMPERLDVDDLEHLLLEIH